MAKYSTGGSSGSDGGDTCELCGASSDSLREANVAGARLLVCPDCSPHDDAARTGSSGSDSDGDRDRKREAVRNAARASPVWDGDSSKWEEEGTDYDDDPLPYLVSEYGERIREARQEAGLQRAELADDLGIREADLLAIEQGRATQAGIGGSVIESIEDRLDVTVRES